MIVNNSVKATFYSNYIKMTKTTCYSNSKNFSFNMASFGNLFLARIFFKVISINQDLNSYLCKCLQRKTSDVLTGNTNIRDPSPLIYSAHHWLCVSGRNCHGWEPAFICHRCWHSCWHYRGDWNGWVRCQCDFPAFRRVVDGLCIAKTLFGLRRCCCHW